MRDIFASMRPSRADDASYFRSRALQEQIAAQEAKSEGARSCHDQLAAMYRFRAMMALSQARFKPVIRERIAGTVR